MPDPLSLMLDSMILAVDEGHSYDGIVSLPGMGLEDFGRRPGRLAGWLDDCMELFREVKPRVTGLMARFSRKVASTPSVDKDASRVDPSQASHTDEKSSQGRYEEAQVPRSPGAARLPRKKSEQAPKPPNVGQNLPKEESGQVQSGQVLDDVRRQDVDQSSPIPTKEGLQVSHTDEKSSRGGHGGGQAPRSSSATERMPRKRGEQAPKFVDMGQNLPEEGSGQAPGDASQSSPIPKNVTTLPTNTDQESMGQGGQSGPADQEKSPRKRKVAGQTSDDDEVRQPRKRG